MRRAPLVAAVAALAALALSPTAPAATGLRWATFRHVKGIIDMAGPRADGRFLVAREVGVTLLGPGRRLGPFAPDFLSGYFVESHLAVSPGLAVRSARCAWRRDAVYAIAYTQPDAVQRIDSRGTAHRFAGVPGTGVLSGIAFDYVGDFGHRLLVTRKDVGGTSSLSAVDCRGRTTVVATGIPPVEGGMQVAPRSFGRHAGELVAPDEISGDVAAIRPDGRWTTISPSLPRGDDIGPEGVGFVPPGFGPRDHAYLVDRKFQPPYTGTQSILALGGGALLRAGVRPGDLLVATESGGLTARVRCGRRGCSARRVAAAFGVTHAESNIVFGP